MQYYILLALSREMGVKLELDDFERIRRKTPHIADMRPGGTICHVGF